MVSRGIMHSPKSSIAELFEIQTVLVLPDLFLLCSKVYTVITPCLDVMQFNICKTCNLQYSFIALLLTSWSREEDEINVPITLGVFRDNHDHGRTAVVIFIA